MYFLFLIYVKNIKATSYILHSLICYNKRYHFLEILFYFNNILHLVHIITVYERYRRIIALICRNRNIYTSYNNETCCVVCMCEGIECVTYDD